ncbi:DUF998 domain-containing protein [Rhodococcus sp. NPDC057135]|uniref:DUF998 domain-containing protein n=1 Tax=Rhodococcus sp. NPDC057135 TaxID=3346028 RepID=UPI00363FB2F1
MDRVYARAATKTSERQLGAMNSTHEGEQTPSGFAFVGTATIGMGALMVLVLDVVTAWRDPDYLRQTISEYGLGSQQWVFSAGVVLLAVGSVSILRAIILQRMATLSSVAARALVLWTIGLIAVVAVPKQDWSNDPTIGVGGAVHRIGAIVAFLSLPIAIFATSWPWFRDPQWRFWSRLTGSLGLLSAMFLVPIFYALVVGLTTTTPWYRAVTVGYVERGLVVAEVVALISLGLWVCAVERRARHQDGLASGTASFKGDCPTLDTR